MGRRLQPVLQRRLTLLPFFTAALLALLLVTVLAGGIWHNHQGNSEANCSVCHLSHQPMERPLTVNRTPCFGEVEGELAVKEPRASIAPAIRLTSPRAPPTA